MKILIVFGKINYNKSKYINNASWLYLIFVDWEKLVATNEDRKTVNSNITHYKKKNNEILKI